MARLTARGRRRIKKAAFVYPKSRSYPIHDRSHAQAALRMSARSDTSGSYTTVRRAVCRRYPNLGACQRRPARRS